MRLFSGALLCLMASIVGLTFASSARADEDGGGFFLGVDLGRAPIDTNNRLYEQSLESSASGSGTLTFTKPALAVRQLAWSFDTGYLFLPYLGVEASYLHFGRLLNQDAGKYVGTDGTSEGVYGASMLESRGPALGLLFRLPLVENLALNVRLADYYAHTTVTDTLVAAEHTYSKVSSNDSSVLAGVGVSYTVGAHWLAKLDYLRIDQAGSSKTMKYDISMVSAGMTYAF